jgi:hypothetical protein
MGLPVRTGLPSAQGFDLLRVDVDGPSANGLGG